MHDFSGILGRSYDLHYDLFREPVLAAVAVAFLLVVLVLRFVSPRKADIVIYVGAFLVTTVALDPVLRYVALTSFGDGKTSDDSQPMTLWQKTVKLRQFGSADFLREEDPFFGLLQLYLKANPAHPLVVIDDAKGETSRWAAYYLAPRPIVRGSERILADAVPQPGDPPRWVLAGGGMPALPENAEVSIEGRVGSWILLRLTGKEGP